MAIQACAARHFLRGQLVHDTHKLFALDLFAPFFLAGERSVEPLNASPKCAFVSATPKP
jgi:hypothetical protein